MHIQHIGIWWWMKAHIILLYSQKGKNQCSHKQHIVLSLVKFLSWKMVSIFAWVGKFVILCVQVLYVSIVLLQICSHLTSHSIKKKFRLNSKFTLHFFNHINNHTKVKLTVISQSPQFCDFLRPPKKMEEVRRNIWRKWRKS